MDLFTLFGTIAVNADAANKTIDGTASKAGGLAHTFSKVSNSAVSLGKTLAKWLAVGSAGAFVKASVGAYAEYEQLIGGIDTLFQDSYARVMEYANNAYTTAGLSANKYMQTVTSFSATLIKGLGGDTAKAAEVADMAVTDMADNANKMGTPIESIQNAYQGFAKQNYTMLDNLKLGYGGTKKEMQRLLKDAQKLSGKKFNIKNFNDVIEAIHVIQEEMGITETTAEEASETIAGSWLALGSSWENLLVGLADGNADIDTLMNNLFISVENVAKNVGKVLPSLAKNIGGAFANILSRAGTSIKDAWENKIYPSIRDNFSIAFGVELPDWDTLKSTISTKWEEVKAAFSESGLVKKFSVLMPDWDTVVEQVNEWWNGDESVYSKIKSVLTWTLGEFVEPSTESVVEAVRTWWTTSAQPSITEVTQWTFGNVVLPSWLDFVGDVTTWWQTTIQPKIKEITTWSIGDVQLPSAEEVADKIKTWWGEVMELVNFYQEYDPSKIHTPEELDAAEKWTIDTTSGATTPVKVVPTEDSESEIQSEVSGYDINGEALIKADPKSKAVIQAALDAMKLSVSVTAKLVGLTGVPSHATGLDYVPTDNYLAYLHRGEAVLTAAEAAVWRRGMNWDSSETPSRTRKTSANNEQPITVNVNVTGNSNPYAIADEVKNALELLRWQG